MAAPFNSYSFCNGILASANLCDYEYFLLNETSVKKSLFCVQFLQFSAKYILCLIKYRSRRARVDQNDIKFVFYMKNWILGFIIALTLPSHKLLLSKNEYTHGEHTCNARNCRSFIGLYSYTYFHVVLLYRKSYF